MQKKQRVHRTKPDETTIHTVGQERFVSVQKYNGDLPTGEPNDWFMQSDECVGFLLGTADTEPHENR